VNLSNLDRIWLADFEFGALDGALPEVRCAVFEEVRSGQQHRLWLDGTHPPPFPIEWAATDTLVAYYASAEIGCFLQLGWPLPPQVLDLFTEFRCLHNGLDLPAGSSLLGALTRYGLPHIESVEKGSMRELALRGGPYSLREQEELLDYCESDVKALHPLLKKMSPNLDLPRALIRGRYMVAVASMERVGIPIDTQLLRRLNDHWGQVKQRLVAEIDREYGVYEGGSFSTERFERYLIKQEIPWPRTDSGRLSLNDETFRSMAKKHPKLSALRELRHMLGQTRLMGFTVGPDGRNRCLLSPFRSRTSRNQPSNSKFIFGSSVWARGLIKPSAGMGLAYIDYSQQEFGIAAALSGDEAMREAYHSGDPYLSFAKLAGAVPPEATKKSHPRERSLFKATVLAVQYGMGPESLAQNIQKPLEEARHLLKMHRQTFRKFWKWSDSVVNYALLHKQLWTVLGWRLQLSGPRNVRSLANFPMQANGAEILRVACIQMFEAGIRICAPVHDAVLIEASLEALEQQTALAQDMMEGASEQILSGFRLKTDADFIRYPDRYCDEERGREFWEKMMAVLEDVENG
jgi:DNA polymerase-1